MAFNIKGLVSNLIDIGQTAAGLLVPGVAAGPIGSIVNNVIDGLQKAVLHPDVAADPTVTAQVNETLDQLVQRVEAHADTVMNELGDG